MPCSPGPVTLGARTDAAGIPAPIRPIALVVPSSVNHRLPSAPAAMPDGLLPEFSPVENSLIVPLGVIRPIALVVPRSVNHRLPSAPAAMPDGLLPEFSPVENPVIVPLGVIRRSGAHWAGRTVIAGEPGSAGAVEAPARTLIST